MPQVQQSQSNIPYQLQQSQPQKPLTIAESNISRATGLTSSADIALYQEQQNKVSEYNKQVDKLNKDYQKKLEESKAERSEWEQAKLLVSRGQEYIASNVPSLMSKIRVLWNEGMVSDDKQIQLRKEADVAYKDYQKAKTELDKQGLSPVYANGELTGFRDLNKQQSFALSSLPKAQADALVNAGFLKYDNKKQQVDVITATNLAKMKPMEKLVMYTDNPSLYTPKLPAMTLKATAKETIGQGASYLYNNASGFVQELGSQTSGIVQRRLRALGLKESTTINIKETGLYKSPIQQRGTMVMTHEGRFIPQNIQEFRQKGSYNIPNFFSPSNVGIAAGIGSQLVLFSYAPAIATTAFFGYSAAKDIQEGQYGYAALNIAGMIAPTILKIPKIAKEVKINYIQSRSKPKVSTSYSLQDVIKIGETPEGLPIYRAKAEVSINRISHFTGRTLKTVKAEVTSDVTLSSNEATIGFNAKAQANIFRKAIGKAVEDKLLLSKSMKVSKIDTLGTLYPIKEGLLQGTTKSAIKEVGESQTKLSFTKKGKRYNLVRMDVNTKKIRLPQEFSSLSNIQVKVLSERFSLGKSISQTYLEKGKVRTYSKQSGVKVKSYLRQYNIKRPIITDFNKVLSRTLKQEDITGTAGENIVIQRGKLDKLVAEAITKTQAQQVAATIIKKELSKPIITKKVLGKTEVNRIETKALSLSTSSLISNANKVKEKQNNVQISKMNVGLNNISKSKSNLEEKQKGGMLFGSFEDLGKKYLTDNINRSSEKTASKLKQATQTEQTSSLLGINPSFSFPGEQTPNKPRPKEPEPTIQYPFVMEKKPTKKKKKAFRVELYQGKKWIPVATNLPYQEALGFGSMRTTQTLSRRFRVTPTGQETEKESSFLKNVGQILANKFRSFSQKGGVRVALQRGEYIQRAPTSLGTREERRAIVQARRVKAKMF